MKMLDADAVLVAAVDAKYSVGAKKLGVEVLKQLWTAIRDEIYDQLRNQRKGVAIPGLGTLSFTMSRQGLRMLCKPVFLPLKSFSSTYQLKESPRPFVAGPFVVNNLNTSTISVVTGIERSTILSALKDIVYSIGNFVLLEQPVLLDLGVVKLLFKSRYARARYAPDIIAELQENEFIMPTVIAAANPYLEERPSTCLPALVGGIQGELEKTSLPTRPVSMRLVKRLPHKSMSLEKKVVEECDNDIGTNEIVDPSSDEPDIRELHIPAPPRNVWSSIGSTENNNSKNPLDLSGAEVSRDIVNNVVMSAENQSKMSDKELQNDEQEQPPLENGITDGESTEKHRSKSGLLRKCAILPQLIANIPVVDLTDTVSVLLPPSLSQIQTQTGADGGNGRSLTSEGAFEKAFASEEKPTHLFHLHSYTGGRAWRSGHCPICQTCAIDQETPSARERLRMREIAEDRMWLSEALFSKEEETADIRREAARQRERATRMAEENLKLADSVAKEREMESRQRRRRMGCMGNIFIKRPLTPPKYVARDVLVPALEAQVSRKASEAKAARQREEEWGKRLQNKLAYDLRLHQSYDRALIANRKQQCAASLKSQIEAKRNIPKSARTDCSHDFFNESGQRTRVVTRSPKKRKCIAGIDLTPATRSWNLR